MMVCQCGGWMTVSLWLDDGVSVRWLDDGVSVWRLDDGVSAAG